MLLQNSWHEGAKTDNEPQKYLWLKIIRFGHQQMQEHICGTLCNEIIISLFNVPQMYPCILLLPVKYIPLDVK